MNKFMIITFHYISKIWNNFCKKKYITEEAAKAAAKAAAEAAASKLFVQKNFQSQIRSRNL